MITLRVEGKPTSIQLNAICTNHYAAAPEELEIGQDAHQNPTVVLKHSKPIDSIAVAHVSGDNMSMTAHFLPAINGGRVLALHELMDVLFPNDGNILRTLSDKQAIENAYDMMKDNVIVFDVVIAVGRQPINGTDSKLHLFFDLPSDKPTTESGGKTNYRSLNKFVNVRKEQLLIRIMPGDKGTPGSTLTGIQIPQVPGKEIEITPGDGVKVNNKNTEYYATVDGYIIYKQGRPGSISVASVIDIRGNVDFGVGDIDFVGDVNVSGDIMPGFTVKGKNVNVNGICQSGNVIADESINIKIGVKNNAEQTGIVSGGTIVVGYCESAKLAAKGSITINKYAFNSIINTGDSLIADNKTTITGGSVQAFKSALFYNLGTQANTNILVSVGHKYDAFEKLDLITQEKKKLEESVGKISVVLDAMDLTNPKLLANPKIKKLVETRELINKRIELFSKRIETLSSSSTFDYPVIEVNNEIQDGVQFKFFDTPYTVRKNGKKLRYTFDKMLLVVNYETIK